MLLIKERMATEISKKNEKKYCCNICHFNTCKLTDYNKHILTQKHIRNKMATDGNINLEKTSYICENCGKEYNDRTGLWRHKNKSNCVMKKSEPDINIDKELMLMLINQNKELLEIVKNGTNNNNNHTNSHNKAFNLNFFLNETCKNAMNITDFVDSIKLQLADLMDVGELGYVEGISKIIVKNLNNLDETIRPIHCTDKKRETFYVKDEDQWLKEDEERNKIKRAVKSVVNKNIKLLPLFREKYPDYGNSCNKISDTYDKIVIESMTSDDDKNEKIIKKISTCTTIHNKEPL
jgi:hypothetical protein